MKIEEYVAAAMRTEFPSYEPMKERVKSTELFRLLHASVGMSGECGEMFENIDSSNNLVNIINMVEETGDMFWYIANACSILNEPITNLELPNVAFDINDYNRLVKNMVVYTSKFMDSIKKVIFYGKELNKPELTYILSNIYFYCECMCKALNYSVSTVMEKNINKLKARFPDKYNDDAALNRNIDRELDAIERGL